MFGGSSVISKSKDNKQYGTNLDVNGFVACRNLDPELLRRGV